MLKNIFHLFGLCWAFASLLTITYLCYCAMIINGDGIVILDFNSFHEGMAELLLGLVGIIAVLSFFYYHIKMLVNKE